jgi:DNA-binding HxlR family transcriptional regulator
MLRTKNQVKNLCKCPVARALHCIGDTVSLLIIRDVLVGGLRFSDIEQRLPGVSTRTISKKLLHLEEQGVLLKLKSGTSVTYSISPKGKKLSKVIGALRSFGEDL